MLFSVVILLIPENLSKLITAAMFEQIFCLVIYAITYYYYTRNIVNEGYMQNSLFYEQ